jgi:Fe-S cluster biogenesis protein NfuA
MSELAKEKRVVSIYTESNPNPNSMKFVANFLVVPEGESYDFPDLKSAEFAPLAAELFKTFDFVDRVFYMNNFITVTKNPDLDWIEVSSKISAFIKTYLESEQAVLVDGEVETASEVLEEVPAEADSNIIAQIKDVLEEYIKPAVEMDGGAITFESYNEGVVKVLLQGSCSGCPSSTITLKAGIESLLKRAIPEVQSVEAEGV